MHQIPPTSPGIDWGAIETFIGFGRPDAPIVFIGMEERLKKKADLPCDLLVRSQWLPTMDLGALIKLSGSKPELDTNKPINQPTWRPMCDLMLRRSVLRNTGRNPRNFTKEERLLYQVNRLGRNDGQTLLAELLPYPHAKVAHWWYRDYGRFKTRAQYENILLPIRLALLSSMLANFPRRLIVFYGRSNWKHYRALVMQYCQRANVPPPLDGGWQTHQGGCVRAYYFRRLRTRILFVHHLGKERFNTNAQLAAFADIAFA